VFTAASRSSAPLISSSIVAAVIVTCDDTRAHRVSGVPSGGPTQAIVRVVMKEELVRNGRWWRQEEKYQDPLLLTHIEQIDNLSNLGFH
jgi:hypothetical protein